MKGADWYVVQVETGRERMACTAILRVCAGLRDSAHDKPLLEECFSPSYATQHKEHGVWVDQVRQLLPGYVVAVTADPWELARVLRKVPGLTRLLTMGETFLPLSDDDRSWIERWTKAGERTIPMSVARKEGDKIVVTNGPLKGFEAMIERINRRKALAHLEIHAGQLTIHTTVGLAVLPD